MEKREIVDVLEQIAVLLELKGENVFKIRAYQSGARSLESLEDDLDALIETSQLGAVKGIGKALTEKIISLRRSGKLDYFDNLKASVPDGMIEMLEIPGFGPKKIKKVYEELGISDIPALTKACENGLIAGLAGFGKKSEEKILNGIRNREAYGQRHLWWDAEVVAKPILEGLRKLPEVQRAEAAGSLRRGKETVGDLDFIVSSELPAPIMAWFTALPEIVEVTAHGETKASIRLAGGLQADLRVVPDDRFVFALHHFTGSKDHNVKMRQRALSRGFSLSEWGIFKKAEEEVGELVKPLDRKLAVSGIVNETDLFRAFDLNYIPPELREGIDEIELAEKANLPELIKPEDVRGVFHNHTTASDGSSSLEEMVNYAEALGFEYIGIADHSKSSFQANGLNEDRLLRQLEDIRIFNRRGGNPHIFAGAEIDILKDGSLDFDRSISAQLDYCVISVHSSMSGMTEDEMTNRIIRAMDADTGCLKILGHLTGRILLRREGYLLNVAKIIQAAAANGVVIEINAHPSRLDMDWRHWPAAIEAGVKCAINPDAHSPEGLNYYRAGVVIARKGSLKADNVINTLALEEMKSLLNMHK